MRSRRGFTVVELAVALTISGVVLLSARAVFEAVTQGVERLTEERRVADARGNARRLVSSALGSIDVTSPGAHRFGGAPNAIGFSTWVTIGGATPVLERARLAQEADGVALQLGAQRVLLWPGTSELAVDYLMVPGANEAWASSWESSVSAPVAIRLRVAYGMAVETLLVFVGPRG